MGQQCPAFGKRIKQHADKRPVGRARLEVRGLRASYSRSTMRLKAMAVERAPTIATVIQRICFGEGNPLAASTAPRKANGNAKSVCSILIISSVTRMLRSRGGMVWLSLLLS